MIMTTQEHRNEYRKLMSKCLGSKMLLSAHMGNTAETFNYFVTGLMHEIADGEAPDESPAMYVRCAQQVACEVYGVDYRAC
jgi:hypothetical protein